MAFPRPSDRRRPAVRAAVAACALLLALPASARAQQPVRPDSTRRDSVVELPEFKVSVTRTTEPIDRVPAAVGVVDRRAIQRGQAQVGLDEATSNIPGVYVTNRYNYAQDQRLVIRGAGSRANFGTRGIMILLDGIPQTLPDGQSQLTNVEYGLLDRIEVLRGASSALYGNGAGAVISMQSQAAGPERFTQRLRYEAGSWNTTKFQSVTTMRQDRLSGVLSFSRLNTNGPRQWSTAETRLLNLGVTWAASDNTAVDVRLMAADWPRAHNAGALTRAEYAVNPDSASRLSILRGADEQTRQQQLGVTVRHLDPTHDGEYTATVYGVNRNFENALATNPPGAFQANAGIYSTIDRHVGGLRLTGSRRLGGGTLAPRLTAGLDAQVFRDLRRNTRSLDGEPTDSVLVDQRERVSSVGPFAQLHWSPVRGLLLAAGARYDWVTFDVKDRWLGDGADNSLNRPNRAWSGSGGASYTVHEAFEPYANVSTAFETPTTTELAAQPSGGGGFGPLGPQRTRSVEVGARGRRGRWLDYSVAAFFSRVTDAIVQFQEVSGRAFFTNAGNVRNDGLELGLSLQPVRQVRLFGSFTYSNFRYGEYRIQRGAAVDTLDGFRLPGVPRYLTRLGLRTEPVRGVAFDVDHTFISSITANDRGTDYVDNVGGGITNARASWAGRLGTLDVQPFAAVNNLWNRQYAASVIVNAAQGRFIEPAPRRNFYVGAEIGFRSLR